jgi:Transposase and inactivated derivatives
MIDEKDLDQMLTQVSREVIASQGRINLAEVSRRTGISRSRLRKWQSNGYRLKQGEVGRPKGSILDDYKALLDDTLRSGVGNSEVCYGLLRDAGYTGGRTLVRDYISRHRDLIPAPRVLVAPQGDRGQRYYTDPGDCFQMDWGFVNVEDSFGKEWKCAAFCMVCHHCGYRYIEFFPNAKQENLFIGMVHAFMKMGLPKRVLTDNMKSVVIRRDACGVPIYNKDYEEFQKALGFRTDLCKVAHPFTKGKVERLVRYVKENFIAGKTFLNITDLNEQATLWCGRVNSLPSRGYEKAPSEEHVNCMNTSTILLDSTVLPYLAPQRKIAFDGFVSYEGRDFGVPCTYRENKVRVMRQGNYLLLLNVQTFEVIEKHPIDWSKKPKCSDSQWFERPGMPEELPTAPVTVSIKVADSRPSGRFDRFRIPVLHGEDNDE